MASEADRDYLRAFARGETGPASRREDESVEDYAKRIGADPGPPNAKPNAKPSASEPPTQPKETPNGNAGDTPAEKPKAAPAGKKPGKKPDSLLGKAADTIGAPGLGKQSAVEWLASRPTPGGIGTLLVIILLFVAVIVPVAAGYTRLQLLWLTLLGKTELPDAAGNTPQTSGTSSSATSPSASPSPASPTPTTTAAGTGGALPFPMPMPGRARVSLPPPYLNGR